MNKKITFLSLRCFFLLGFMQTSNAQLYSNGSISTGTTAANGTLAPVSYSWSEVSRNTGNTTESNTILGFYGFFSNTATTNIRLADDFVVPSGTIWNVTDFSFYCYQTGYSGTVAPIDVLRIQIFNGDPSSGGVLVAGDMTTNVYDATNSGEALVYRTSNTMVPTPLAAGTTRKVWKIRGSLTASLPSGTYWVVYQAHATNDGNIFFPPVTNAGTRGGVTANAKQLTVTSSFWGSLTDTGNPTSAPDVVQDMPFLINENTLSTTENSINSRISVYPNPVKNIISISNTSDAVIKSIEVTDLNGRIVKTNVWTTDSHVNVTDLQKGIYLMKIILDNEIVVRKIIKE